MSAPPVNLLPVDIAPYRAGNRDLAYVSTWDSGRPGPHVAINALVHGNELCGAHALDSLHRWGVRARRGRLSLSFANVAAYHRFDARRPTASRYIDEDFNRLWSPGILDGRRDSHELRRARDLRAFYDEVDVLLDLHSMQSPAPPLMLAGLTARALDLARALGAPEHIVRDAGHAAGPRLRDYAGFGDEHGEKTALLLECGQHWDPASVAVALDCSLRFLRHFEIEVALPKGVAIDDARDPDQRLIEVSEAVTIDDESFRFCAAFDCLDVVPRAGTPIAVAGAEQIKTPYDDCVLVMPSQRIVKGQTAVRLGRFVR